MNYANINDNPIVIWKNIEGYPNYMVSNYGNVKSLQRKLYNVRKKKITVIKEKIKKPFISSGYYRIELWNNGISKKYQVHQLVAMAFLNHKPNGNTLVINHINFIKTDNRLENLEIVTSRENGNQKHLKSSSKYTGVSWCKRDKKWRAQIWISGKLKQLGSFNSEIEASNKYENMLNNINKKLCTQT